MRAAVAKGSGRRVLCPHNRQKRDCKECGGAAICGHGVRRRSCLPCALEAAGLSNSPPPPAAAAAVCASQPLTQQHIAPGPAHEDLAITCRAPTLPPLRPARAPVTTPPTEGVAVEPASGRCSPMLAQVGPALGSESAPFVAPGSRRTARKALTEKPGESVRGATRQGALSRHSSGGSGGSGGSGSGGTEAGQLRVGKTGGRSPARPLQVPAEIKFSVKCKNTKCACQRSEAGTRLHLPTRFHYCHREHARRRHSAEGSRVSGLQERPQQSFVFTPQGRHYRLQSAV